MDEFFFEGAEKRIEIDFIDDGTGGNGDLRLVGQDALDQIVAACRTQCMRRVESEHFVHLILSESSLFAYPKKLMIKTCGRTVPLEAVNLCRQLARTRCGLAVEWFSYSRKNFQRPGEQPQVHQHFEHEVAECEALAPGGQAYVMGPLNGDHWFLYERDYSAPAVNESRHDVHLDVMMSGLPERVRQLFFLKGTEDSEENPEHAENSRVAARMTSEAKLDALCPGADISAVHFEPCGYSCNATLPGGAHYFSIHVTPEKEFSYASFECNIGTLLPEAPAVTGAKLYGQSVSGALARVLQNVIDTFQPEAFTASLVHDTSANVEQVELVRAIDGYTRTSLTTNFFGDLHFCEATVMSFVRNAPDAKVS